ncbi:MAG: pyridoxamine 5'-phosphate oxidase family protein [Pseudomonadota bacterium]
MGHKFSEIAFTETVRRVQEVMGSRNSYAKQESGDDSHDRLGPDEAAFISERDSFYMATVTETGWPYVQHRGGPKGFVRPLDEKTIGFADFSGNRQYVSVGNLLKDDRVSLFFMDYRLRARLKVLGHVSMIDADERSTLEALAPPDYQARVERGFLITVAAFDWNCPQHITPRLTMSEVQVVTAPLRDRIAELEAELAAVGK